MSLKQNIIYLYFKGKHLITSKSQYQYNHGQFLYFADLDLPQTFEVHFSNRDRGDSKPQVGSNKLVEIPDEYYWSGALMIYAWIYLHTGKDDGETIYEVKIPLIKRAKPTDEEPLPVQQSAIDKAIAELNNAVDITNENADKTDADKTQVATIKEEVIVLKEEIDSTASAVSQDAQSARESANASEQSAQNSAESERKALDYSDEAKGYAQSALESKNTASQKAQVASDASAEAKDFRDEAETFKNEAEQAKQNIVDYKNETKGYRDEALTAKNDVQTIKSDIQSLKTQIDDTADNVFENAREAYQSMISADSASLSASESAENASQSANEANQSASNASESANQAEEFKNQSEEYKAQAGAFKSQTETLKNQAEEFKNQTETNVAHYPKIIGEYWYVWDATNEEYINTNVDANGIKGDTGRGIASIALNDDYTLTITFTDDTIYTTSSIRGQQGEKGDTGKTGESGVYIGTEEPENEDIKVWIDTDDDGTSEDLVKNIESLKKNIYKPYVVDSASGSIASFPDGADGIPLKSLVVDINPVQDLHGYDSPWVGGGGKNLLDTSTLLTGAYSDAQFNIPSSSSTVYRSIKIFLKAGTYTLSASVSIDVVRTLVDGGFDSTTYGNKISHTFTTTTDGYVGLTIRRYDRNDWDGATKLQIEKGSTATDWTPYENICPISGWTGMQLNVNGTVIPISWQSEAGTVYGGKLDVLSGVLRVTQVKQDASDGSLYAFQNYNSSINRAYVKMVDAGWLEPDVNGQIMMNNLPFSSAQVAFNGYISPQGSFLIWLPKTITSKAEFITWMEQNPVELVYHLATPIEIQLTPHEVNSLLGTNNIWADTGDTNVEYRADTKLYINKKITEALASLT